MCYSIFFYILENHYKTKEEFTIDRSVESNGGKIIRPKTAVPGVGWMAYFKDPEGNVFGMMESDKSAK